MKETRKRKGIEAMSLDEEKFGETRLDDTEQSEEMRLVYPGEKENNTIQNGSEEALQKLSVLKTLKHLFSSIDVILIWFFSLFIMHCVVCYDIWQPMAAIELLNWGFLEINLINLGYGVVAGILLYY